MSRKLHKTDSMEATGETKDAASQQQSFSLPFLSDDDAIKAAEKPWIRGVNLGGWLVMERYITPYHFALTDCHVRGDFCWYPGQIVAPPLRNGANLCDSSVCRPILKVPLTGGAPDYPVDEYTLAETFLMAASATNSSRAYRNPEGVKIAEDWLNYHFDHFITETDIAALANAGISHVRVPLPHWILGHVLDSEPWIVGRRWEAFLRVCSWAKTYNLQVWPDIHTSPGSQNGFDNSGHALPAISCQGWCNDPTHVRRSLDVIANITRAVVEAGYQDVVTGFGLLNEPFKDCNRQVYQQFIDQGKAIVRDTLGPDTSVYVSDMFLADTFNDGKWWLDADNTFLDSHYYQVFATKPRELSPRQHIAYTCQDHYKDATSCCYQDVTAPWYWPWKQTNTDPSAGVQRIVGEWSLAYDTLPVAKLLQIMQGIAANGTATELEKEFTDAEKDFLRHYAEAQMVVYEAADTQTSSGWFYWTAKMEGSAFAEWDFLRGVREGWIPKLPAPTQASEDVFGTCYDIIFKTSDNSSAVVHSFPDPLTLQPAFWEPAIDDDVVVSHGQSLMKKDGVHYRQRNEQEIDISWIVWVVAAVVTVVSLHALQKYVRRRCKQAQYTELNGSITLEV